MVERRTEIRFLATAPENFYDQDSDVLYISVLPGRPGVAEESLPGVLLRKDPDTDELVGITVIDFSEYWPVYMKDLVTELERNLCIGDELVQDMLEKHLSTRT